MIAFGSLKANDHTKAYMLFDMASVANIFIVPGGHADLYSVNKVPHGTVSNGWYDSASFGMSHRLKD